MWSTYLGMLVAVATTASADPLISGDEMSCEARAARVQVLRSDGDRYVVERALKGAGAGALEAPRPPAGREMGGRLLVYVDQRGDRLDSCWAIGESGTLAADWQFLLDESDVEAKGDRLEFHIMRAETLLGFHGSGEVYEVVRALGDDRHAKTSAAREFLRRVRMPRSDRRWKVIAPAWIDAILEEYPRLSGRGRKAYLGDLAHAWSCLLDGLSDKEREHALATERLARSARLAVSLLESEDAQLQKSGCVLVEALSFEPVCTGGSGRKNGGTQIAESALARLRGAARLER